jgi:imidazolonepropionase-like amidohydrolase
MKVLRGGTLIDGTGAAPVRDSAIVIDDDGRIQSVLPAGTPSWPRDAEVVDVTGMTVLPGLIDAHDHLASHGYELARRWNLDEPASTRHLRTAEVQKGKRADLVVVDGDPLRNIDALVDSSRIRLVMKDGLVVKDERTVA